MLKVGLVGVGGISGAHIPVWDKMEDAELVALCDVRPEKLEAYTQKHCYTDFDEMLRKEQLDILDICLPTFLHTEFAIKAMEKGIHVLCEKPLSLHREDVKKVYEAAEKNHVHYMVAHVIRFWPEYEFVKELYDSKKYGKLLSGSMYRLGSCPKWSWDNWMTDETHSGLVPYDLHIHDLDFMIYAFGNPKNTHCNRVKKPQQDYIHAVYEYDDFFITADASWYAAPYPFTAAFRFQFEDAIVEKTSDKLTVYENNGTVYSPADDAQKGDTGHINLPKSNAYANEIRYFADCVKENKPIDKIHPQEIETVIDILGSL